MNFFINCPDGIIFIAKENICYLIVSQKKSYISTKNGHDIELDYAAAKEILEKLRGEE